MNPLDPESPAGWLRARQRKFTTLHIPIQGFGPAGEHTLYLPSPRADVRLRIENGIERHIAVPSCLDEPGIREKRDALLRALSTPAPGFVRIELAGSPLVRYAIAIINLAYHAPDDEDAPLSDEDLTLLLGGQKWQEPVLRHAMGGDDVIKQLVALGAIKAEPSPSPSPIAPDEQPTTAGAASRRGSLFSRLVRLLQHKGA